MNKLGTLLKLELKANSALSHIAREMKSPNKASKRTVWVYIVLLFIMAIFLASYVVIANFVMDAAVSIGNGMPGIILSLVCMVYCVVSVLLGTFTTLSKLFMAKDNEFLAALPVSQGTIFSAKFINVYFGQLGLSVFFILPPCVLYAIKASVISAYPLGILAVIIAPVIPLFVSTLLSLLLMRLVAKLRNRDTITTVASILLAVVVGIMQTALYSLVPEEIPENFLQNLLISNAGALQGICAAFPPAGWMGSMLTASGAERFYAIALLVVTIAVLGIVIYLFGRKMYLKSALALSETHARKAKVRQLSDASSPVKAIFKKEWKSILKTPVYAMNTLSGAVIIPIIYIVIMISGSIDIPMLLVQIGYDSSNIDHIALLSVILSGMLCFCGALNTGGATMVTREGKSIWILKVIPIPSKQIIRGKFLTGLSIAGLSLLVPAVLISVLLGGAIIEPVIALIISSLLSTSIAALSLLFDCCRPTLNWQNPTYAIKQTLSSGMTIIYGFGFLIAFAVLAFLLYKISALVMLLGITLAAALLTVISVTLLMKKGSASLDKLEG